MASGGGNRWQDEAEPDLRHRVRQQILTKLAQKGRADQREKHHSVAADIEGGAFTTAASKADYLRRIAMKMGILEQNAQRARQAAAGHKQQTQMVHQMQLGNPVQAAQGGNSLLNPTLQAVSMMSSPVQPPPHQLLNRHMAGPSIQINPKHGPSDVMAMLNQNFISQPATFSPVAPGVQSGQQIMHSRPMQGQNQHPTLQFQRSSFASSYPMTVAQLQGQPIVQPNTQPNHLLEQNASSVSGIMQQPRHLIRNNHHAPMVNQQNINSQKHQMGGTNVDKLNISYTGGLYSQQNIGWAREQEVLKNQANLESQLITQAWGQVTFNQQSNVHCPIPQTPETMNGSEAVDWREEMFQKIQTWKASCFSELMELNRILIIAKITEEQLRSLPKNKAEAYNRKSHFKKNVIAVLNLLQCQKSEISETHRMQLPKYQSTIRQLLECHRKIKDHNEGSRAEPGSLDRHGKPQTIDLTGDTAPFNGGIRNQPKQPADTSISQMRQTVTTTAPPAEQKTRSSSPLGVNFSIKSPVGLNDVRVYSTPSSISKSEVVQVASPNGPLNNTLQSFAKPGVVIADSTCASKYPLTPTIKKSGVLVAASPCSSVKSTLQLIVAKSVVEPVASPCDSVKSTASKDINSCHQATPSKLMVPTSPGQAQAAANQTKDEVHGGAKTPVVKKPIDRLLDAVRASSPAVLRSSINSMKSALIQMDSVHFPSWSGSNNNLKRTYDITSSYSESRPFGGIDDSPMAYEWGASAYRREVGSKRQKIQNAKEALLDEIKDINSTLIETMILVIGDSSADGITSFDGRTPIKLSYTSGPLAPNLKSHILASGIQPLVISVTLLVPADYPASSPNIIYNEEDEELRSADCRKKCGSISEELDAAFRSALRVLPNPRSLKETASAWEACVRRVVKEFAHQHAGGSLGSRVGRWESCVGA